METLQIDDRFKTYVNAAAKFYRTDHCYYHTIHHVINLFNLFKTYEVEFDEEFKNDYVDKKSLFWAIVYHDAFYMPGFAKNEEISAIIAEESLWGQQKHRVDIEQIKQIIVSTIPGWSEINTPSKRIMHDLDWSGFADYDILLSNEQKIINEAVNVGLYDEKTVINNYRRFYKTFVNTDIYLTKTFSKFNDCAKQNLSRRLKELSV